MSKAGRKILEICKGKILRYWIMALEQILSKYVKNKNNEKEVINIMGMLKVCKKQYNWTKGKIKIQFAYGERQWFVQCVWRLHVTEEYIAWQSSNWKVTVEKMWEVKWFYVRQSRFLLFRRSLKMHEFKNKYLSWFFFYLEKVYE